MSAYLNGVSEAVFKVGLCLPIGTCVSDDDVRYIVECIKEAVRNRIKIYKYNYEHFCWKNLDDYRWYR